MRETRRPSRPDRDGRSGDDDTPGPLSRRSRLALLAVAALLLLGGLTRIGAMAGDRYGTNDFAHYYLSSTLLLEGGDVYGESLGHRYRELGFRYQERIPSATNPPVLVALFAPLAAFPPERAYWLWALVQLGALAGSLWLLRPWVSDQLGAELWWIFAGSVVVSNTVYFHFFHSQVQLLVLFLLLAAFRLQRRGLHTPALLSALAAGLLKIFPLVLLPWFAWKARRRPRAWVACGLATAVAVASTAGLWPGFLSQGAAVVRENTVNQTMNFSLPSLVVNLAFAAEGWSPSRPGLVWAAGSAAGLLLVAGAYGARGLRNLPDRQTFSLLLGASVAGGLTGWPHYFVLLIPGFALLTVWTLRRPTARRLAGLALVYLFVLNVISGAGMEQLGEIPHILANYLPLYGLLALLAWLAAAPRVRPGESGSGR